MLRIILTLLLSLMWAGWQTFQQAGGSGGEGSGQSGSGGAGGQTGGAGGSGSGEGSGGQGGKSGEGAAAGTGFEGEFNPEQARALIDKLRPYETQAAELQTQLTEAQSKLEEYEQASQSELETATKTVANLEADKAKLQQEVRQLKVRVLAGEIGVVDTQAASLLLKWDELGDDPKEETVKAALDVLVKERPWLKGATPEQNQQQTPGQSATNQARSGGDGGGSKKIKPGRSRIIAGIAAAAKNKS